MAEYPNAPADWYADPADPMLHRWWDGTGWTGRLKPAAPLTTQASSRRSRTAVAEHPEPRELQRATSLTSRTELPPPPPARNFVVKEQPGPPRPATVGGKNRVATVAVLLGIIVTYGFAVAQSYELPLTFLFAPSLVALATAALAFNRARRTGAGLVSSTIALVVTVPQPAIAVWAFATELSGLIS